MLIASNSVFSRGEDNLDAKDWIESGIWRNGFNVDPDVSVNIDEFKSQYEKKQRTMGCYVRISCKNGS